MSERKAKNTDVNLYVVICLSGAQLYLLRNYKLESLCSWHGRTMYAIVGTWLMLLCKNCKKGAFTNSIDPDETPHNAASHRDLHYLPC